MVQWCKMINVQKNKRIKDNKVMAVIIYKSSYLKKTKTMYLDTC